MKHQLPVSEPEAGCKHEEEKPAEMQRLCDHMAAIRGTPALALQMFLRDLFVELGDVLNTGDQRFFINNAPCKEAV